MFSHSHIFSFWFPFVGPIQGHTVEFVSQVVFVFFRRDLSGIEIHERNDDPDGDTDENAGEGDHTGILFPQMQGT